MLVELRLFIDLLVTIYDPKPELQKPNSPVDGWSDI